MPTYANTDIAAAVARGLDAARDRPIPADSGRTPEKYARLSDDFRGSAWKHLQEGDLPQTSNKAWGMVAETIKAISAQHGGIIHSHRAIWQIADELSGLVAAEGDRQLADWINNAFSVARNLHANFYADEESPARVASNLRLCEELSAGLYELFWPERLVS